MSYPKYTVIRYFAEAGFSYLNLQDARIRLLSNEKKVRVGTLAELIEWARPRKDGAELIQMFLTEAIWIQKEIHPLMN